MSREDNYHLSSVTVIASLTANNIHGRSVTRQKHFALRKLWSLRGQGVLDRKSYVMLLSLRASRATRCFLPDQKILILAGLIAFSKSQNTFNYIAATRFTRDYLKL